MRFPGLPRSFLLLLCLLPARLCHAQLLSCTVSTAGIKFRPEALADPIGDVLLQCVTSQQPPAGQSYVIANSLQIFINTSLANRTGIAGNASMTDAVLVINGNDAPPTTASTLGGPAGNVPVPQFGQLVGITACSGTRYRSRFPARKLRMDRLFRAGLRFALLI
jgi:hypothetical protein